MTEPLMLYGEGDYGLSAIKEVKVSEGFLNLDEKDKNLYSPKVSVRNTVPKYDIAVISAREELRRLRVRGDTPRLLVVTHQQTAHLGV